MLRLRDGHAVTGNDDDALRVGEQQRHFVGLNRFDRSGNAAGGSRAAAAGAKRAEQNIRDRAVHRLAHEQREQRAGGADERAGDDHREIVDGKSVRRDREAGEGIQQRNDDRHVRAADGHDHRHAEKQREAEHDDERGDGVAAGGVERQPAAQAENDQQNQAVQKILAGKGVRLFKFSLQLQIRDDAAGKRERADERGEQHRDRDKRRDDVCRPSVRRVMKFQARDQRRRAAAEAVEHRHHLRHRGHLHRIRADRADDEADDRADGDERVIETSSPATRRSRRRVCAAPAAR